MHVWLGFLAIWLDKGPPFVNCLLATGAKFCLQGYPSSSPPWTTKQYGNIKFPLTGFSRLMLASGNVFLLYFSVSPPKWIEPCTNKGEGRQTKERNLIWPFLPTMSFPFFRLRVVERRELLSLLLQDPFLVLVRRYSQNYARSCFLCVMRFLPLVAAAAARRDVCPTREKNESPSPLPSMPTACCSTIATWRTDASRWNRHKTDGLWRHRLVAISDSFTLRHVGKGKAKAIDAVFQ